MSTLQEAARSVGARRILEIGTGDGAATMELASALPADGMLLTMEPDAAVASAARQRFATAGLGERISVMVGIPSRFLHKVSGPFDVVAEHTASGVPVDRLLALVRDGGLLITADKKYIKKATP